MVTFNAYCTSCGTKLIGQARYCPSCGDVRQEYTADENMLSTAPFADEPRAETPTRPSSRFGTGKELQVTRTPHRRGPYRRLVLLSAVLIAGVGIATTAGVLAVAHTAKRSSLHHYNPDEVPTVYPPSVIREYSRQYHFATGDVFARDVAKVLPTYFPNWDPRILAQDGKGDCIGIIRQGYLPLGQVAGSATFTGLAVRVICPAEMSQLSGRALVVAIAHGLPSPQR